MVPRRFFGRYHRRMRALLALTLVLALPAVAIERSAAAVREFRAAHACPATARHRGACPGFQVDHVRPLCAGGEDLSRNMQWISVENHRWKTFVDVRECRKLQRAAARPATVTTD